MNLVQEIVKLASEYAEHKHLDEEPFAVALEQLLRKNIREFEEKAVDDYRFRILEKLKLKFGSAPPLMEMLIDILYRT